jgi:zinc finger RNA-binding protein
MPVSPGEGLKLVFEAIANGLILPTGPGLLDPCEKDVVDALGSLPEQAKQDITNYAQVRRVIDI